MNRTLDVAGYHRLPRSTRCAIDRWLIVEELEDVFELTLICEGIVTVGRYRLDDHGNRFFDRYLGAVAQERILHAFRTPLPAEAFAGTQLSEKGGL